jgi:hypothetical protein
MRRVTTGVQLTALGMLDVSAICRQNWNMCTSTIKFVICCLLNGAVPGIVLQPTENRKVIFRGLFKGTAQTFAVTHQLMQ